MQSRFAFGSILSILLVAGYAVVSYYAAINALPVPWAFVLALAPLALALLMLVRQVFGLAAAVAAAVAIGWLIHHFQVELRTHVALLYYLQHAGMMLCGALFFGLSLLPAQEALCVRFARYGHATLNPELERYARGATVAWTLFFVAMGVVSTLLFFSPLPKSVWSAFDTLLTLPLVGLMFAAEYAARRCLLPHEADQGITGAWRAYQAWRADHARQAGSAK